MSSQKYVGTDNNKKKQDDNDDSSEQHPASNNNDNAEAVILPDENLIHPQEDEDEATGDKNKDDSISRPTAPPPPPPRPTLVRRRSSRSIVKQNKDNKEDEKGDDEKGDYDEDDDNLDKNKDMDNDEGFNISTSNNKNPKKKKNSKKKTMNLDYYFGRGGEANALRQNSACLQLMKDLANEYNHHCPVSERRRFVEQRVYNEMTLRRGGRFFNIAEGHGASNATRYTKRQAVEKLMQTMRDMKKRPDYYNLVPSPTPPPPSNKINNKKAAAADASGARKIVAATAAAATATAAAPAAAPSTAFATKMSRLNVSPSFLASYSSSWKKTMLPSPIAGSSSCSRSSNTSGQSKGNGNSNMTTMTMITSNKTAATSIPPADGNKKAASSTSSVTTDNNNDDDSKGYTDRDVLCGRPYPWILNHPGNIRFHQLLEPFHDAYRDTPDGEKLALAQLLVEGLFQSSSLPSQGRSGMDTPPPPSRTRFLERSVVKHGVQQWTEIDEKRIVKKVCDALRRATEATSSQQHQPQEQKQQEQEEETKNGDAASMEVDHSVGSSNGSRRTRKRTAWEVEGDKGKEDDDESSSAVTTLATATAAPTTDLGRTKKPRRASAARASAIWKGQEHPWDGKETDEMPQKGRCDTPKSFEIIVAGTRGNEKDHGEDDDNIDEEDGTVNMTSNGGKEWLIPCGRGGVINMHPGHRRFHTYLHGRRTRYLELPIRDRRSYAQKIVKELQQTNGLFNDGIHGDPLSFEQAVGKTMQTLRDGCSDCRSKKGELCRENGKVYRGCRPAFGSTLVPSTAPASLKASRDHHHHDTKYATVRRSGSVSTTRADGSKESFTDRRPSQQQAVQPPSSVTSVQIPTHVLMSGPSVADRKSQTSSIRNETKCLAPGHQAQSKAPAKAAEANQKFGVISPSRAAHMAARVTSPSFGSPLDVTSTGSSKREFHFMRRSSKDPPARPTPSPLQLQQQVFYTPDARNKARAVKHPPNGALKTPPTNHMDYQAISMARNGPSFRDGDVLFGADFDLTHHPGNIKFQTLVQSLLPLYENKSKIEKTVVSRCIVQQLFSKGVRFLQYRDSKDSWDYVSYEDAVEKTSDALLELHSNHGPVWRNLSSSIFVPTNPYVEESRQQAFYASAMMYSPASYLPSSFQTAPYQSYTGKSNRRNSTRVVRRRKLALRKSTKAASAPASTAYHNYQQLYHLSNDSNKEYDHSRTLNVKYTRDDVDDGVTDDGSAASGSVLSSFNGGSDHHPHIDTNNVNDDGEDEEQSVASSNTSIVEDESIDDSGSLVI